MRRLPVQPASATPPATADRHVHRLEVETGDEPVHVTIGNPRPGSTPPDAPGTHGGYASVPGGYARLFNRVVDSGAWVALPDAARGLYVPLARFADGRNDHRVRIGIAGLVRHSGLSRSTVKRGLKALLDARLLVVVSVGGAGADGVNRSNVYQLLVPDGETSPPVPLRTHPRSEDGPTFGPSTDRPPGSAAAPRSVPKKVRTRTTGGPLFRTLPQTSDNTGPRGSATGAVVVDALAPPDPPPSPGVVARLEAWGVSSKTAADLARRHPPARVDAALAAARAEAAGGRLRSPAGFVRTFLEEGWTPPPQARAQAPTPAYVPTPRDSAADHAVADRAREDARLDALDDAAWQTLTAEVLDTYRDHPAMLRLLTARPARQSRLMRAEVIRRLGE